MYTHMNTYVRDTVANQGWRWAASASAIAGTQVGKIQRSHGLARPLHTLHEAMRGPFGRWPAGVHSSEQH